MPDLPDLVRHHLAEAHASERGRSAELLLHDDVLRQTVIALTAGTHLAEHNSPHAGSIQVLLGRMRVTGVDSPELAEGQLALLTHHRHAVTAITDCVFLLTTVTGVPDPA